MLNASGTVAGAPVSNIEAEDAITLNWTEEAEAALEQFEQPYISCTLGWGGLETSTGQ